MTRNVSPHIWMQEKIRRTIPLSNFMQFEIVNLEAGLIETTAPLEPNVNLHGTGFAGSIYSASVLTGWALCSYNMSLFGMNGNLVVSKAEIIYKTPVEADFKCSSLVLEEDRQAFFENFRAKGKSKLSLDVNLGKNNNAVLHASYYCIS